MRIFSLGLVLFLVIFFPSCTDEPGNRQANIVLIFIDDWAWNGTPVPMDEQMPNSQMPVLNMPRLEMLAGQGMKFRNAYPGAPQCSPSRVCLQTGKSAARSGFTVFMNDGGSEYYDPNPAYGQFPVVPCVSDMSIDSTALTIPELLGPLGYACAHVGKWHMRGHPADEGYLVHDGPTTNKEGNQAVLGDPKLMFSITQKAMEFMEEQVQAERPFFVQISHYAMHAGFECLPETRAKYVNRPEIQAYYQSVGETAESIERRHRDPATWMGMGEDLDGRIGAVMDKIDALGIADNTYVMVVSDNGYRHFFYPGLGQPLHGGKWWVWQGGIRVPMIARGPGIPAASLCEENVVNYDFLPTFVEWAGGNPGQLEDIDGVSLAPLMRGESVSREFSDRALYFHYPHYRTSMPHAAMVIGHKKLMHFFEAPDIPMLFDLSTDEGEVHNLAEAQTELHMDMYRQMMDYFEEVGARIPKENPAFDRAHYEQARGHEIRAKWGPFKGSRALEEDEQ